MILDVDGAVVIDSDSLDQQRIRDSSVTIPDEETVEVHSDGPVSIEIRHEGVDERIV